MAEIVVITGGTRWRDASFVFRSLAAFHRERYIIEFVNGMASEGVDQFVFDWAEHKDIPTRQFPADWNEHGERAGPIRNQQMIDENPDITVGLVFPGHRGTTDMARRLRKAGIERVFFDPGEPFNAWG